MKQRPVRIGLWGLYGWGSLGDAANQHAMIANIRRCIPDVEIIGICPNPEDATERFGIPAYPISRLPGRPWLFQTNRLAHAVQKAIVRIPMEIWLWVQAWRRMAGFDLLIVSGGGQLDDYDGGAFRQPYNLLKWATVARLRGVQLKFASMGAGPIDTPLGRKFINRALGMASFRSYRDENSRRYIASVGFDRPDPIYPDLAWSLDLHEFTDIAERPTQRTTVAINPMAWCDPRGWPKQDQSIYDSYIARLTEFTTWLLHEGYAVRFITGDVWADRRSIADVRALLAQQGVQVADDQLFEEPIYSVNQLLTQLAQSDIVVATRFHNILFGLYMCKPTLCISYHDKDDSLMKEFDQGKFCVWIDDFSVEQLKPLFKELAEQRMQIEQHLAAKVGRYQQAMDEQFGHLLGEFMR
ncbi:MAG: polysaccharide pyruvyl transferase family protein [Caldilineaceae bacterium]